MSAACRCVALALLLGVASAATPTSTYASFSAVMKIAANMTVQLLVLDESMNAKALGGRVTKADVASASAAEDRIVEAAAAQIRALPGLTGNARSEAMTEFSKAAYNILNETRTRWAKLEKGQAAEARWFASPVAEARRIQLMGAWQKGNVAVLQAVTNSFSAGTLTAAGRDSALARVDAAAKKLRADLAAIPGATPEEKAAAARKVDSMYLQLRTTLDATIRTLLTESAPKPKRMLRERAAQWWR